jgi:hypothetical protein
VGSGGDGGGKLRDVATVGWFRYIPRLEHQLSVVGRTWLVAAKIRLFTGRTCAKTGTSKDKVLEVASERAWV